jgi:hypothetical protein
MVSWCLRDRPHAGGRAALSHPDSASLRDRLHASGQLIDGPSPDLLAFATNVVFTSPSAAASIVSARSASGPIEWKIQPPGTPYREWRASRLEST